MGNRAAIYARISRDIEGKKLGVTRQVSDCRDLADQLGLKVVAVFDKDNDLGASTRSRSKHRPDFDAMLAAAERGEFDTIIAYSNSRLTRRPLEFEILIKLYEDTGITIKTVVSGSDDLSTADGRMIARIKADIDTAESERIAERVTRKHLENAQSGKPVGGSRPFGWNADKTTIRPGEADLIRAAVSDAIAGVPLKRIADRWNEAGVLTPYGNRWLSETVKVMIMSPRLAGWRVHRGKVAVDATGTPVRGQWEAIITQEDHEALKARLTRPERRSRVPRRGARHYLLTGMIRCGTCNSPMYGNRQGPDYYTYQCSINGHVNAVSGPSVEEFVEARVLKRIGNAEFDVSPPEFTGDARIAEIGEQIGELMAAYKARQISGAVAFGAVEALETERDDLERQRATVAATVPLQRLSELTVEDWVGWDTDRRRAAAESMIQAVMIRPATRRLGNKFDNDRVDIVWKA